MPTAWTFTSPLQRPWFDVLIYVPLVFLPPSRLDWVILGRAVAGNIAYIPGVGVILHPRWGESAYGKVVMYVAPGGRLLALLALHPGGSSPPKSSWAARTVAPTMAV